MNISTSSGHTASTDFPDPLSLSLTLFVLIIHQFRQLLQTASCVRIKLLQVRSSQTAKTGTTVCTGLLENVTYEFILASSAVSLIPSSSNLDCFRDRRQVAVQLLFQVFLLPGLVQYSSQCSCAVSSSFLSIRFVDVHICI